MHDEPHRYQQGADPPQSVAAERADMPAAARGGSDRVALWIALGPIAVLASWIALVFIPAAYRMQALYAAIAVLSVAAFATSFYLSGRGERRAPAAPAEAPATDDALTAASEKSAAEADDSEARFRLVVEAAPNAIIMIDANGTIQLLNSQTERLFGYDRSELLGKSVETLLPPAMRAMHRAVRGAFVRAPQSRRMGAGRDLFGLRKDGIEVPVEIGLNPITTRSGTLVLASIIDITERKRAEQALRASEERFRLVVEDGPNAMIMVDRAGSIALLNAESERLFGYARDELVGKPVETLVPERFRGEHPGMRSGFLKAPQARPMGAGRELFGLRKDGTEMPIEIGLNPIRSTEGEFVLASVVDITERKRAQQQIAAALTEKTVLLNEIHHRVKNNLQVIMSLLNLQAGRARDPALQALVNESRDRVQAMALIHQLLFERKDWSRVQLRPYLQRLGDLLTSTYGSRGRIELEVNADDVDIDVQRAVPCGLLVNELVTNAFKHAFADNRSGSIRIELRKNAERWATLSVSDTGVGLPDNLDIDHIESLGMQLVPLLADQVRGELTIGKGPGARFELRFPLDTAGSTP